MNVIIDIPEYSLETGICINWENSFAIAVHIVDGKVIIRANEPGLISLAQQLLTLAQSQVPRGHHLHYDEYNSLEDGSCELIIEKA